MPAAELGTKQICPTCQSKFYDLTRRPAHCPKCGTDFDPEEALRNRRVARGGRVYETEDAKDQVADKSEDAEEDEEEDAATPEIDEGADDATVLGDDDDDGDGSPQPAEDLGDDLDDEGASDEEGDDVPFLEDDDDSDLADDIEGLPEEGDSDDR